MLEDESVIEKCIEYGISVRQYFFMYLIHMKDAGNKDSLIRKYIKNIEPFNHDEIERLVERGYIDDFNSPGSYLPEMYIIQDDIAEMFFFNEDDAEKLWKAYPATFPLYDKGASFIARGGGDKDELLSLYRKKIKNSKKKHAFVMEMLEVYKSMVKRGKINGYKLSEFIAMELWDTIAELVEKEKGGSFGEDI